MRTFHLSWLAFFLCFFGWFGIAPLMPVIREELALTQAQVGNLIIASVSATVLARLFIGWLVDRIGPRITYTCLLIGGAFPVMLIGLSHSYESFLLFRLTIGIIGASFVITQYHTSVMFASNIVGTANATSAGWGNLGGGVTQMVMPALFALFVSLGFVEGVAWRYAMVVPGIAMLLCGMAYYRWTKDFPEGNMGECTRISGKVEKGSKMSFWRIAKDKRVWALFLIYGACFGIELTINNIAAIYYHDRFGLNLKTAGLIAGLFGLMNLFARSLGGYLGDKAGLWWGLNGRVKFLGLLILMEGFCLFLFSKMSLLPLAVGSMIVFSLFVQMAEGATFSVVPFVNKRAIGTVSGIVGAGGNAGAVLAGFLFGIEGLPYAEALTFLGIAVALTSMSSLLISFSPQDNLEANQEIQYARQKEVLETAEINS